MKTNKGSRVPYGGQRAAPAMAPQWIGVPSRGHCPITGLSRPHFYQLIAENRIRSACIRQPGAIRGRRLVYLPSVLEFLDRAADAEAVRSGQHAAEG